MAANCRGIEYAIVLLDLVKAFERIPHWYLIQQARRYGLSTTLLKLSIGAYRLGRAVGVEGVFSVIMTATRGITAGSVFATIEMRLVMLQAVDDITRLVMYDRLT